ncbi:MAG: galactose oxidase [Prochlorococcaceae cyanobacterium]
MGLPLRRSAGEPSGSLEQPIDAWPFLERDLLLPSRSRKVCMTCHWFRHHSGVNCIPLLTCQLHQGLLAQGEHLTHRCHGWTDDMARQRGWAPEAG